MQCVNLLLVAYFKLNNNTTIMFNLAKLKLSYKLRHVHSKEETILKDVVEKECFLKKNNLLGQRLYFSKTNYLHTCLCCTLFCCSTINSFHKNLKYFIF